jgi:SNF2 family DNA or RNA helicase
MKIALYSHQKKMSDFWLNKKRSFNLSDAGTGKTLASIDAFFASKNRKKMLVFAPVSILKASWGNDIKKFGGTYEILTGTKARKIDRYNKSSADILICSHEFSKFIIENELSLENISHVIIDECTAYKNHTAQRSRAIKEVVEEVENLLLLSGTPINNSVEDLFYPTKIIDGGKRLGKFIMGFRDLYRYTKKNPYFTEYKDKIDARERVAQKISDISIRFKLRDCVDLPSQITTDYYHELSTKCRSAYENLKYDIGIKINKEEVKLNSLHSATKTNKLLQILTGAVYDESSDTISICPERYKLIVELANQREHTIIVYNWRHQLPELQKQLKEKKLSNAYISGNVPMEKRSKIVEKFQKGKYRVLIIHSKSCSHGLTLTKATSLIWSSPTYSAEIYNQVNARICRISQTEKTEIIRISATNTKEVDVYNSLNNKLFALTDILKMLTS